MPNWCNNKLIISHKDKDVLDNLMAQVRAGDGDLFQFIKPMPDELNDNDGWYDWRVSNWGTKWDACNMSWSHVNDNVVEFDFDTAWSPPFGVYEQLAQQEFEVEAYFVEYGMMFAGEWHCDAEGNKTEDFSNDISEYVPECVDDIFNITEQLEEWKRDEEEWEKEQEAS